MLASCRGLKTFSIWEKSQLLCIFFLAGHPFEDEKGFIGFRMDLIYTSELSIVSKYIIKQIIPHSIINYAVFYVILVTFIVF